MRDVGVVGRELIRMFLRCKACEWSQDDFWTKTRNPIRFLLQFEQDLLDFENLDKPVPTFPARTHRDLVISALETSLANVKEMYFLKPEDTVNSCCPMCGKDLVFVPFFDGDEQEDLEIPIDILDNATK